MASGEYAGVLETSWLGVDELGTSAMRVAPQPPPPTRAATPPTLNGPGPVRNDERLGAEVDERLVAWFKELDVFTDQLDRLRDASFGRLAMLTHPDTDDPDRLMLAARWAVALWATDDVYTDDEAVGAVPQLAGPRLARAVAALSPPPILSDYAPQLEAALRSDPILRALRSSIEWVAGSATPSQVDRARYEVANTFVMWEAKAAWRMTGHVPSVWEYLSVRQIDNFQPCMALIDVVGGYEVPANVFHDPRVRRATALAGSVAVVANDIYSMARESGGSGDFNLPTLIAAEERCSLEAAIERSVEYHNGLVRAFEAAHRELVAVPSPELQRFLLGLWAWIGGSDEWHRTSGRYHTGER